MYVDRRIVRGMLVAVGATALLAVCGPQSQAGAPAPTTVTVSADPAESEDGAPAEGTEPATGDPAPCTTDVVEPKMAEGDHSQPDVWNSAVIVTNVGTVDCRVEGGADITFIAPSGDPYDIPLEEGEPGDEQPLEVWHPETLEEMPLLCGGPVSVSGWSPGGF